MPLDKVTGDVTAQELMDSIVLGSAQNISASLLNILKSAILKLLLEHGTYPHL